MELEAVLGDRCGVSRVVHLRCPPGRSVVLDSGQWYPEFTGVHDESP